MPRKFKLPSGMKFPAIISLSFALSFMVFFFAPLDIYLHNASAFIIDYTLLIPWYAIFTITAFLMLLTILTLLWRKKATLGAGLLLLGAIFSVILRFAFGLLSTMFALFLVFIAIATLVWILSIKLLKENAIDIALLLLWGVLAAAYIQLLFMNGNMTGITGASTQHSSLSLNNIVNISIWIVISLLPLCLWIILRVKKKDFKYEKILIFSTLIMLGMQTAGLIGTASGVDLPRGEPDTQKFLSYKPLMEFHEENNIVVFLVDAFDTAFMLEALEKMPEISDIFDGFTLFTNNIAEANYTFPSIPMMLTGHRYSDEWTVDEFLAEAWAQESFIDTLRENNFTVNLLIDGLTTYGNAENLINRADNLVSGSINIHMTGLLDISTRLALGRISPYFLKNTFLRSVNPDFGNHIFYVSDVTDIQHFIIGSLSDMDFYQHIQNNSISVNNNQKVFSFIHLNGFHVSNRLNFDTEENRIFLDLNNADIDRMAVFNVVFGILETYFTLLIEADVFDNTTILIMADHSDLLSILMIKPKNASGELVIDAKSELSNKYFGASIVELAGLPHERFGISYFDIINGAPAPARRLYIYSSWYEAIENFNRVSLLQIREVIGDASNPNNWRDVE